MSRAGSVALRFGVRRWAVAPAAAGSSLPPMLRRRLGPLGRAALDAALAAGYDGDVGQVFASRYGELARSIELVAEILRGDPSSPASFSLSVHNALAGLASIACRNRQAHTAIAAGQDTLFAGLMEAAVQLAEAPERDVVLVYCDDPVPAAFQAPQAETAPVAIALRLFAAPEIELAREARPDAADRPATDGPGPVGALVRFLEGRDRRLAGRGVSADWSLAHAA